MSKSDQATTQTLDYYNRVATDYSDKFAGGETPFLAQFIDQLLSGQLVLDLGCGPGHCARDMANAGLRVEAIDGAAEMVELAKRHPGVIANQAMFDELDHQNRYDAIWANFSLLHAPRAQFPDCLARIYAALKPNGLFHIGMKLDQDDGVDRLGRHYTYYRLDELKEFLNRAGFEVVRQELSSGKGMAGNDEPCAILWSRTRKKSDD